MSLSFRPIRGVKKVIKLNFRIELLILGHCACAKAIFCSRIEGAAPIALTPILATSSVASVPTLRTSPKVSVTFFCETNKNAMQSQYIYIELRAKNPPHRFPRGI